MRWLAFVFVLLILALQYPMWLGKGGWFSVRELGRSVARQQETNAGLKARNDALDADVRDLKTGFEAIEERARSDLGMVRADEVFFQLQGSGTRLPTKTEPPAKSESPPAAEPAGTAATSVASPIGGGTAAGGTQSPGRPGRPSLPGAASAAPAAR